MFPSTAKNLTDTWFQQNLKDGWMASIPVGDTSIVWTGMDNNPTSWYMYYPMMKNGSSNNGFLLVTKTETEWWSNFVYCPSSAITPSTTDVEKVTLCNSIISGSVCWTCTYAGDKSQLRYIYKY
jgi:hypothetical protein